MAEAFVSDRIVTPEGERRGAVLVQDGQIAGVCDVGAIPANYRVTRCPGALLPGLVDTHIHINQPGRTEWEGFTTATRAAAAAGYTTLVDMPLNCLPATTTVAALEAKRAAAQGKCMVDWAAWGGLSGNNIEDLEPLAAAGVRGFKCFLAEPGIEGFSRVDEAELRRALPHIARTGLPLLVHAEDPDTLARAARQHAGSDWRRHETWLRSRPDEAEVVAIRRAIALAREFGVWLHIVHLATAYAVEHLREARSRQIHVTAETCPHYLYFDGREIPDNSVLHKCAPPIRSAGNRELLWEALREGDIDLIATDHSPCPPEMKQGNFAEAWGGIAGVSVALPVVWSGMRRRGFTLADLAVWMAANPAELAGVHGRKGKIAKEFDADLVVFDPEDEWIVTKDQLHTRHALSAYEGERLFGTVTATYLRGELIYDHGGFIGEPRGREIRR
ncbi:MAG TPA: allantoinase AllB [Acidobacteriaceae bacterium]|jgi:allantoinase|nr:allantoinase AllB [Acidobacteriaceae bacterium]